MVYACTAAILPSSAWLQGALELHGRVLADERVYEDHGNHALNQAIGLLEVGCVLHRAGWLDLAARRINGLVVESVDAQGVTNEQAIGYEYYNYNRYQIAAVRLKACGETRSTLFSRIGLMPTFLGWATLPDRAYEQIGDTTPSSPTRSPAPSPSSSPPVAFPGRGRPTASRRIGRAMRSAGRAGATIGRSPTRPRSRSTTARAGGSTAMPTGAR